MTRAEVPRDTAAQLGISPNCELSGFTTALGAKVKADVDINPTVVGLGFGYKF